jgi:periplasmic divalent cation tolerance protein
VAREISKILIKEKLIACSNILPTMESHYVWKGKTEKAAESVLILKSDKKLAKALTKRVLELHPYDTPCVIELPVESVSEAYGLWLHSQLN